MDNDCDGLVDDADDSVDLSTGEAWYPDGDGDGYGDGSGAAVLSCAAQTGLVLDASDCDDGDFDVNPNASEVCTDGVDNDCSGDAPECALRGEYELADADLSFGETSLKGAATDQDNDGLLELVVGMPDADSGGKQGAGAVVLIEQPYGTDTTQSVWRYEGRRSDDGLGYAVAGNNDLNGDGFDDLAVAAPGSAAVYLFYGGPSGHSNEPDVEITGNKDWTFGLGVQSTESGQLIVSSPGLEEDASGSRVYFWSDLPAEGPAEKTADWSIWQPNSAFMGFFFTTGVGDLNGDGNTDLFTAAADISEGYLNYGPLEGGEHTASDSDSVILDGVVSVAFGDLNGDAYEELVLGNMLDSTNGDSAGAAFIFQGGADEFTPSLAYSQAAAGVYGSTGESLGLVTVGDTDGNGIEDMILAAVGGTDAYLFYGPVNSDKSSSAASAHITGYERGVCFWPLSLGDIDQDGSADLIVSCAESDFGLQILMGTPM